MRTPTPWPSRYPAYDGFQFDQATDPLCEADLLAPNPTAVWRACRLRARDRLRLMLRMQDADDRRLLGHGPDQDYRAVAVAWAPTSILRNLSIGKDAPSLPMR